MLNKFDDEVPKVKKAKIVKKEKASFAQMLDSLDDKTFKCYYCDKVIYNGVMLFGRMWLKIFK